MAINILGISCFYHDSAACIIKDGIITAAAQEERFSRKKHDFEFPSKAVHFCLKASGITEQDLSYISFYDKPWIKFERILETYLEFSPRGIKSFLMAMPIWLKEKLRTDKLLSKKFNTSAEFLFFEHHESHAASAFFPSPFKESAILTLDGVGEWTTTSLGVGIDNKIDLIHEMKFPHSIGLFYSAFTYYLGFKVNSGEYKVMGLAPYGEPKYVQLILDNIIDLKEDGSFKLNMKYFDYCVGLTMTSKHFNDIFGDRPRDPESEITEKHLDIAASLQLVTEEVIRRSVKFLKKITGKENLCLAGGVALNCVCNGKLLKEKIFKNIWVQPASGDAGGAIGAALLTWHHYLDKPRQISNKDSQFGSFLGPEYSDEEIEKTLKRRNASFIKYSRNEILHKTAELINMQNVIGWFQGRMEFGPRALGARSIIGDARSPKMQSLMNLKIKFRESFRPFAPSILAEKTGVFFEIDRESPYMLFVSALKNEKRKPVIDEEKKLQGIAKLNIIRSDIPAVTHVDYSARLHTVSPGENKIFYDLIKEFYDLTGCPVIINTSFNVRGEPIVCTPDDAYNCFMGTNIDYLIIGNFLLDKKLQPYSNFTKNYLMEHPLD